MAAKYTIPFEEKIENGTVKKTLKLSQIPDIEIPEGHGFFVSTSPGAKWLTLYLYSDINEIIPWLQEEHGEDLQVVSQDQKKITFPVDSYRTTKNIFYCPHCGIRMGGVHYKSNALISLPAIKQDILMCKSCCNFSSVQTRDGSNMYTVRQYAISGDQDADSFARKHCKENA